MSLGRPVMLAGAAACLLLGLASLGYSLWGLAPPPATAVDWTALLIAALGAALLLAAGYLLAQAFARSQHPGIERLAEDTRIIYAANPAHRASPTGFPAGDQLVEAINGLAARFQSLQDDVEGKVRAARTDAEDEKNRLAALMAQLTQAVMVCSVDGRIILYNNSARQLLAPSPDIGAGRTIGLGRSIYPLLDRNLVAHGLEIIRHRLEEGDPHPVANFVTSGRSGQLVRIQMGPVGAAQSSPETAAGAAPEIGGFVLTLEDVTRSMEAASRTDAMVQAMTSESRASLANIRAAVETIVSFPDMEQPQRENFIRIINEEVDALGGKLASKEAEYAASLHTHWTVEEIRAQELLAAAQRRIEQKLGIHPGLDTVPQPVWLRVDSYALVQALSYLASRLSYETQVNEMTLRLAQEGRLVHMDLVCPGAALTPETWNQWEVQPLRMGGEASPLSLRTIMERHGGELWYQTDQASRSTLFRLVVPLGRSDSGPAAVAHGADGLGYVDVDPSRLSEPQADRSQTALSGHSYTAFFAGTTDTGAASGEAIFALGAIHIVGGQIVTGEVFYELVDPGSPISAAAASRCGIAPSDLEGRPRMEQVLPAFWRFCQGTVLLASDAAAKMRLLRAYEVRTGTRFAHPVIDPVRLFVGSRTQMAATNSLGDVAAQLGIAVKSHATALDLALVTAQVFVKLMPLLAERGISSLDRAAAASLTSLVDSRSKP